MLKENAARRNRALRKIRQCRKLPQEIKATLEAILDCFNPRTDYAIAWPSAATLANRLNRSVRTIRWHLKAIKQTGIFGMAALDSVAGERIHREELWLHPAIRPLLVPTGKSHLAQALGLAAYSVSPAARQSTYRFLRESSRAALHV